MSNSTEHWESVYERKPVDQVSWFRPHLEQSLGYVDRASLPKSAAFVDVGAGASTFVDDLLARGFPDVTLVDLSSRALDVARRRLGAQASAVKWLVGDLTRLTLPEQAYDFWHDRAVFHFLQDPADRARYVAQVRRALKPGGHLVVATFGPDGPQRCSELDTMRYSEAELHGQFGPGFLKLDARLEHHQTPSGKQQEFLYCYCRKQPGLP